MTRLLALVLLLLTAACSPRHRALRRQIDRACETLDARTGVAVRLADGTLLLRGDTLLPMMSLFKFPVALAVLDRAAARRLPLDTPLDVDPEWLDAETYSPLRDSLPPSGGTVPLSELLRYCVSLSDNIACDRLIPSRAERRPSTPTSAGSASTASASWPPSGRCTSTSRTSGSTSPAPRRSARSSNGFWRAEIGRASCRERV